MRSHIITSVLTIVLALSDSTAPAVGETIATPTATQQQTSEIDRAIVEDDRLMQQKSLKHQSKQILSANELIPSYDCWNYLRREEYQISIKCFQQTLENSRKTKNQELEMNSLHGLGWIKDDLGNYQQAIDLYQEALKVSRNIKNQHREADLLNVLGWTYYNLGQYQVATELNQQSIIISKSINYRSSEGYALVDIGLSYRKLKKYKSALKFLCKALSIARETDNAELQAFGLRDLGYVYQDMGEHEKALDYYQASVKISQSINRFFWQATGLNDLGRGVQILGKYPQALDSYQKALQVSQARGYRAIESKSFEGIANLMEKQNQPEIAIAIYKQSVNVYESIRKDNEKLPKELRESYTKSISYTYQELAKLLIKKGRFPEAQAVLELLKLKEITTYTRDTQLLSKGISFTAAEQKALDEFLNTYGTAANFASQLTECAGKCPNLAQLEDQRDRINTTIREMLDRLRNTLKDQVIDLSKLNTEEFNVAAKEIVNAQPGTVLIYPIITETKIQFLLAFKAGAGEDAAVTFRAIDGETLKSETLFETANQFRDQLASSTSNLQTLQTTSQKLYNWLIKPLEPEINHPHIKHLVFVTDRATRHIPIAARHDGKNYLITKPYTITTVLSASGTKPTAPPPTSPKLLAVGASQFQAAPALPYVETETNAIVQTPQNPQGIFPGDRYLNTQFTFNALKSNLKNHNILHIATHGFLDAVNIDNSYLLTSNGEKIDKSKIKLLNDYGLNNIHMVILSACNTGTGGKNSDNLEIAGISHYFMTNGAKSVIASLWQVNDPATALFMQQFYRHLKSGKTKAQAIQKVQQDFIDRKRTTQDLSKRSEADINIQPEPGVLDRRSSATSFAHPYYWAPFILIGNNL